MNDAHFVHIGLPIEYRRTLQAFYVVGPMVLGDPDAGRITGDRHASVRRSRGVVDEIEVPSPFSPRAKEIGL
ncbi:MAG: hypothetical protein GY910_12680 [bacterium]|nr:hypothetical protein [Deltaproteobacteria bacterium]MCP4905824.1 hypothetical protein [bacterium]